MKAENEPEKALRLFNFATQILLSQLSLQPRCPAETLTGLELDPGSRCSARRERERESDPLRHKYMEIKPHLNVLFQINTCARPTEPLAAARCSGRL